MPTYVLGSGVGDNYATLLLTMVDVDWFKQAVMGALYTMAESNNWRESGDVDVSFAVEETAKMLESYKFMNFNPFPIGMVMAFADYPNPDGFLICDGSEYDIVDYPELYAVIGTQYGGGGDTFAVPDLRDRSVFGSGVTFDHATSGGEIDHTLDVSEIPSHSHTIPMTATTLAVEPGEVTVLTPIPFFTQDTGSTGGGGAHNNMPPYLAMDWMIYAGRV